MSEEVVPESPDVVKGGPLDPTSPEGQPPEGEVVGGTLNAQVPPAVDSAIYKGLTGEIKSVDDLKNYTKQLEALYAEKAAQASIPAPTQFTPVAPIPKPEANASEKFSELIFSKPAEAFEVAVGEAQRRIDQRDQQNDQKKQFWGNFYEKYPDLKNVDRLVQSIVRERGSEISGFKTEVEVSDYLSKESRKLVDYVRKSTGVVETKIPSQQAVTLGASGEAVPRAPSAPKGPTNFAEQIRRLRPHGKK